MKRKKIALVLFSAGVGGTERRIGNLFKFLSDRHPDRYILITNRRLYNTLQRANYHLEKYDNIHIVEKRSAFDRKSGAHAGILTNIGRVLTLFKYRAELKKAIRKYDIGTIQVFLEMVPFLGVFPIKGTKKIASLVSHITKYYDRNNVNCRLLLYALRRYDRIDCVGEYIGESLLKLGVNRWKVNYPRRNFVNHIQFRPEKKEKIVTFSSRMIALKNPFLLLDAARELLPHVGEDVRFYIMGKGKLLASIKKKINSLNLDKRVVARFFYDPSLLVNKSMIHVCVEALDNFTNQTMLEGMASGCAIVASDVGLTKKVVTPDVGLLVKLTPQDIARAVRQLLDDPDLARRLGEGSRKKVLSEHSIDMYIDYITKVQDFSRPVTILNGVEQLEQSERISRH